MDMTVSAGSGRGYPSLEQLHAASLSTALLSANNRSFAFEPNRDLHSHTAFSPPDKGRPYQRQLPEQQRSLPGAVSMQHRVGGSSRRRFSRGGAGHSPSPVRRHGGGLVESAAMMSTHYARPATCDPYEGRGSGSPDFQGRTGFQPKGIFQGSVSVPANLTRRGGTEDGHGRLNELALGSVPSTAMHLPPHPATTRSIR